MAGAFPERPSSVVAVCVLKTHKAPRPNVTGSLKSSTSGKKLMTAKGTASLFNRSNETDANIKLNQTATSNRIHGPTDAKNLTHPKICVQQWQDELITAEQALYCIDRYMEISK